MTKGAHLTLTLLVLVSVGALLIFLRNSDFWNNLGTSQPEPGLNLFGQQLIGTASTTTTAPSGQGVVHGLLPADSGPPQGTPANLTATDIAAINAIGFPTWNAAHTAAVTTGGQPGYVFSSDTVVPDIPAGATRTGTSS